MTETIFKVQRSVGNVYHSLFVFHTLVLENVLFETGNSNSLPLMPVSLCSVNCCFVSFTSYIVVYYMVFLKICTY